jgi:Fe-S-cluster containining protein
MRFSCTLCGDCCTGSQVVRLTRDDLGRLVSRLGLASVRDLRTQGLVSLVREPVGGGRFAWRPRIRFRSHPLRQCPFLVNDVGEDGVYRGLCSLHPDFKPLVCTLSPLAREVEDSGADAVTESWTLIPPVEGCPGVGHGPTLDAAAPPALRSQLDAEVAWVRALIAVSPSLPDEAAAWAFVAEQLC